ncbi:hypothetical protein ISCGN_002932 [Ixodes scapularis]
MPQIEKQWQSLRSPIRAEVTLLKKADSTTGNGAVHERRFGPMKSGPEEGTTPWADNVKCPPQRPWSAAPSVWGTREQRALRPAARFLAIVCRPGERFPHPPPAPTASA